MKLNYFNVIAVGTKMHLVNDAKIIFLLVQI